MTKTSPACDIAALQAFVHTYVPQAIPLSFAGGEATFLLPSEHTNAFADLFLHLEQEKNSLSVGTVDVSLKWHSSFVVTR